SGLFLQGQYGQHHWNVYNNDASGAKKDGKSWHIQGGWSKNVFGAGNSTIYGEYGHGEGYATGASIDPTVALTNGNFAY
ncbi:hypothetical protein ABTG32_18400, partial [Acinetobacter baumannii]